MSPPAKNEAIASVAQLTEMFGATAVMHEGKLEFTLRPTLAWLPLGEFLFYTLRISPDPLGDLAHLPTTLGHAWIIDKDPLRTARFQIVEGDVGKGYVVAHFRGGKIQGYGFTNVLIPLSVLRELAAKRPNQSSEPTPTSGTSAAEQPRVPAAVVAHL